MGGGSIEAVAPGIAEALVATAVGLAAAIPAVWFFNVFNNQIARINSQMESFSQDFLNLIERSILIKKD
jgi:biopolymer transport protein TolQ